MKGSIRHTSTGDHMWISVIAVGVIIGAVILKERESRKKVLVPIPVKVNDGQKARQNQK